MKETVADGKLPELGTPSAMPKLGFLFDVDNTLLDNDRVIADLRLYLREEVGEAGAQAYWAVFDELRSELGYADYLGALQRYRIAHPTDLHPLTVSRFLLTYPFASRLFPRALAVLADCSAVGVSALLSDGDVVFQPWKIESSGLYRAVAGRVLVYVHKEQQLADVDQRLGCDHYVMVDDKLRLLAAVKAVWRNKVTTVFVRQGHYAMDLQRSTGLPPADFSIACIADLSTSLGKVLPERTLVNR